MFEMYIKYTKITILYNMTNHLIDTIENFHDMQKKIYEIEQIVSIAFSIYLFFFHPNTYIIIVKYF